jgi:hypothetical protein
MGCRQGRVERGARWLLALALLALALLLPQGMFIGGANAAPASGDRSSPGARVARSAMAHR